MAVAEEGRGGATGVGSVILGFELWVLSFVF
jgi:hypothetical protein